ncbi:putative sulfotransferase [Streptomyces sulfonofaciens]|uniref:Sulfotransferase n=1 Tax=Streptomyces sulfonofaciens TaxID=68272 RepID=A0A919L031_9ACTN|nr:sulfotransferase [Streptomyces sulfonofaciens]GHH79018.1 putative sulfotransferase [Streptomyces sulfonofaciens]
MDTVRIEDLAEPRFSAEVREIFDAMATMAPSVAFEPDVLMEAATTQTDLDDFGDPGFREPLDVLCRSLEIEAGLSASGRTATFFQLVELLKNRLRIEDLVARHPEITRIPIERPIVITGLFRTGSTHLHNVLSADPALRELQLWEANEPVPPPGESLDDPTPRIARTTSTLELMHNAMPHFKRMLDFTPTYAHEELNVLALQFASMHFETQVMVPSYRDWYLSNDQTPAYAYLKRAMQAMTWLRGERAGRRWILKCPQHLEQLRPLMNVFPDARVVFTHRDPAAVTASMATMVCYALRMSTARPDPAAVGKYWAERLGNLLDGLMRDRDVVPAEQSLDVRFHEFMADEKGTVRRIYEMADQPYTHEAQAAVEEYLAGHRRGRNGRVDYRLSDLGLDVSERRAAFAGYVSRFGLKDETVR